MLDLIGNHLRSFFLHFPILQFTSHGIGRHLDISSNRSTKSNPNFLLLWCNFPKKSPEMQLAQWISKAFRKLLHMLWLNHTSFPMSSKGTYMYFLRAKWLMLQFWICSHNTWNAVVCTGFNAQKLGWDGNFCKRFCYEHRSAMLITI